MIEEHIFFALEIPFEFPQIIVNCYNDTIPSIYEFIEAISDWWLILIPSSDSVKEWSIFVRWRMEVDRFS